MVEMNFAPAEALEAHLASTALPLELNNARELGGIVLKDGRKVRRGVLLRTSRLFDASERDLEKLRKDYHLALVLDMRDETEIRPAPDPVIEGVKWVHTPIIDFAYLKKSMAAKMQAHQDEAAEMDPDKYDPEKVLNQMLRVARMRGNGDTGLGDAYAGYLAGTLGREKIGLFFHELAALRDGAALWHCHTGKDRTGIAAGLILEVLGADWETIAEDYEASNLCYLREIAEMEAILRARGVEEELIAPICGFAGVYRPMLETAWRYMEENWGGAVGYLKDACGVSVEEMESLRARYIE
jgi:protein-tyrosine phosphatase